MRIRKPQEWADFLGMRVACFSNGKGGFEYRAFEEDFVPFVMAWTKFNNEINTESDPEVFYSKNRWVMTKDLANTKYDSLFRDLGIGENKIVASDDNGETHYYKYGKITNLEETYCLNLKVVNWDKNIYFPSYEDINWEENNDIISDDSNGIKFSTK